MPQLWRPASLRHLQQTLVVMSLHPPPHVNMHFQNNTHTFLRDSSAVVMAREMTSIPQDGSMVTRPRPASAPTPEI